MQITLQVLVTYLKLAQTAFICQCGGSLDKNPRYVYFTRYTHIHIHIYIYTYMFSRV